MALPLNGDPVIRFDGRRIVARAGESVLAALAAAGVRTLGHDARGAPRGAWCGMGACQSCLMTIDGAAARRACMEKVRDGMLVLSGEARPAARVIAAPAPAAPRRVGDVAMIEPPLLVVGAGPAGLSAALTAARAGVKTLIVDERGGAGGQYFKQLAVRAAPPADAQHRLGADLFAAAREAGVGFSFDTIVWGAFHGPELVAARPGGTVRLRPRALILATGAIERGWPVEGWTLPGVMTTGAAQTLWRTARRLPPGRVLIAGNGPLNLQLAAEIVAGGGTVVALVEAAPPPGLRSIAALAVMAHTAPRLVARGIAYRAALARAGVSTIGSAQVVAIRPDGDALAVELDDGRTIAADTVCLGYGLQPADELARLLGCDGPRDADGGTSGAGIWRIGDGAAIGGAHVAQAEGVLAGVAAARYLGFVAAAGTARASQARHRAFQAALWQLYAPAAPLEPRRAPDTIICRCEGVRARDLDAARTAGASAAATLKRMTRAGMGACQGRYCARYLHAGSDDPGLSPRIPIRPVDIAGLAR